MSHEYEHEGGGSGFVMGLLTGTVLGAGLGMLFAPKAGSELRGQIGEGANTVGRTASQGYRKAADAAGTIAEKSKHYYGRARQAVSRGSDEARRYAEEFKGRAEERMQGSESRPTSGAPGQPMTNPTPGSNRGPGGI